MMHGCTKTTNLNCLTRELIDTRASLIYTGVYILITLPAESGKLGASAQPHMHSEVSWAAKIHSYVAEKSEGYRNTGWWKFINQIAPLKVNITGLITPLYNSAALKDSKNPFAIDCAWHQRVSGSGWTAPQRLGIALLNTY